MAYEPKDGSGALFKNDKGGNEARPDYRGDLMLNGVQYEISSWLKTAQNGNKFMSLSVKPKQERQQSAPSRPANKPAPAGSGFDDLDDSSIPF